MPDPMIASLVREVLAEELSRLRAERGGAAASKSTAREESVRITNDAELQAFVARLISRADDGSFRQAVQQGRILFRLEGAAGPASSGASAASQVSGMGSPQGHTEVVERGFFSERQADGLPKNTKRLQIGKAVRMTPLARDRLRQRGITIERME